MIIFSILFLLLSNAVTLRRDKSILFSRVAIIVLLYSALLAFNSLYITYLERGAGYFTKSLCLFRQEWLSMANILAII